MSGWLWSGISTTVRTLIKKQTKKLQGTCCVLAQVCRCQSHTGNCKAVYTGAHRIRWNKGPNWSPNESYMWRLQGGGSWCFFPVCLPCLNSGLSPKVGWDFARAANLWCILEGSCFHPFSLPCLNWGFSPPRLGEILRVQLIFDASMKEIFDASMKGLVFIRLAYHVWTGAFLKPKVGWEFCVCSCFVFYVSMKGLV